MVDDEAVVPVVNRHDDGESEKGNHGVNRKHVPGKQVIDEAMTRMKRAGILHPKARFNRRAAKGLRTEVAMGDIDLKQFLQRSKLEKQIVDEALDLLTDMGLIAKSATYPKRKFEELRRLVKSQFKGSWSSLSPQMERLLFALTAAKRPRAIYEFGCFWGNTLAWFCGPMLVGAHKGAVDIGACDIDKEAVALARDNFSRTFPRCPVRLECRDALEVIEAITTPLDFIYIETKAAGQREMYRQVVEKAYDKLAPGAWVIGHDTERYTMYGDLAGYLDFVRDKKRFEHSIAFDIDQFGLELSIKR